MLKLLLPALLAGLVCIGSAGAQVAMNPPVAPAQKMFGVFDSRTDLVSANGFGWAEYNLRVTATDRRLNQLASTDTQPLDAFMTSAQVLGLQIVLNVWQVGWRLDDGRQYGSPGYPNQYRGMADVVNDVLNKYPQIKVVILGVEPNRQSFWRNQDNAPVAYESWLATFYDQIKIKDNHPDVQIYGGSLASSADSGGTGPEAFIAGMCQAYQASGKSGPIMDGFAMHSWEDSAPDTRHPGSDFIAIGDYQKLERDLSCFGWGPVYIIWNEIGYESRVPRGMTGRYTGTQSTGPQPLTALDETTQGKDYVQAMNMTLCQPYTKGIFIFHMVDDPSMTDFQTGLYYANAKPKLSGAAYPDTAKVSLTVVRNGYQAIQAQIQSQDVQCGN